MSSDQKALVLRWFEEWWNQRSDTVMEEITTPDCLSLVEGLDGGLDRAGLIEYRRAWISAVPDLRVELPSIVTEGDKVIVQWRARGTHKGPVLASPHLESVWTSAA